MAVTEPLGSDVALDAFAVPLAAAAVAPAQAVALDLPAPAQARVAALVGIHAIYSQPFELAFRVLRVYAKLTDFPRSPSGNEGASSAPKSRKPGLELACGLTGEGSDKESDSLRQGNILKAKLPTRVDLDSVANASSGPLPRPGTGAPA